MQIKTTMRFHLTTVRMAVINNSTKSAGQDVEKGEPVCTAGGGGTGSALGSLNEPLLDPVLVESRQGSAAGTSRA